LTDYNRNLRLDVTMQYLAVVDMFDSKTHLYKPVQDLQQHTASLCKNCTTQQTINNKIATNFIYNYQLKLLITLPLINKCQTHTQKQHQVCD